jgi:hypothetical protein
LARLPVRVSRVIDDDPAVVVVAAASGEAEDEVSDRREARALSPALAAAAAAAPPTELARAAAASHEAAAFLFVAPARIHLTSISISLREEDMITRKYRFYDGLITARKGIERDGTHKTGTEHLEQFSTGEKVYFCVGFSAPLSALP